MESLEPSPRRRPRPHAACSLPSSRRLCLPSRRRARPRKWGPSVLPQSRGFGPPPLSGKTLGLGARAPPGRHVGPTAVDCGAEIPPSGPLPPRPGWGRRAEPALPACPVLRRRLKVWVPVASLPFRSSSDLQSPNASSDPNPARADRPLRLMTPPRSTRLGSNTTWIRTTRQGGEIAGRGVREVRAARRGAGARRGAPPIHDPRSARKRNLCEKHPDKSYRGIPARDLDCTSWAKKLSPRIGDSRGNRSPKEPLDKIMQSSTVLVRAGANW